MRPYLWRLLEWWLRRVLPPHAADAACGDLLEDFEHRRRTMRRRSVELWVMREAVSIARAYRADRSTARQAPSSRQVTRAGGIATSLTDFRIAVRTLVRQPIVFAAVVLPVALAIAANTALYSLTDGLLYRELRLVRDRDSLVAIDLDPRAYARRDQLEIAREQLLRAPWLSDPIWTGYHVVFDEDRVWRGTALVERAVSANFFDTLGIPMRLGRGFVPADADAGGPPPVVIGHDLWRTQFSADPAILQAQSLLADARVRVVGVAPRTFDFPGQTNVWSLQTRVTGLQLPAYARVADGFSVEVVRQQAGYPLRIRALADAVRPSGSLAIAFLFGATAVLLLVSWLQVGALLFARAAGRSTEIGIRMALGAGRGRLFRAFMAEGAIVAIVALGLGCLATPWAIAAVVSILPEALLQRQQVEPDLRTLIFACVSAAAGVLLLSVLPMELLRRVNPLNLLRGSGSAAAVKWSAGRMRSSVLLAQVALTVVLLYVSGLVAHSFLRIASFDLGFDPDGVLVWRIPRRPTEGGGPIPRDPAARAAALAASRSAQAHQFGLITSALDELRGSPGIRSAAASRYYPVIRAQSTSPLTWHDAPDLPPIETRTNNVTPEFFDMLGLRLVEGETFAADSLRGIFDVAVVNQTLATRLRAHGPAIGQRIRISGGPPIRVVGVVADYVDEAPDRAPDPQAFLATAPDRSLSLWMGLVRVAGDVEAAKERIRAIASRTWGAGPEISFTLMADELSRATAAWRARTILLMLLSILCLPLAASGLFGALNYDTRSQAREIAVRLALGANPAHIRRRVVARALGLVVTGGTLGLAAGSLVGRLMASYLFGVSAADALTMIAVGILLLLCAWVAALGPALRASRIDPTQTLRDA